MEDIPNHPVYSKNVLEMLTVANDFVATLTRADERTRKELIDYLTKVGGLLYLKGNLLPEVIIQNPEYNARFFTEEDWQALFNELRQKFGKHDEFWFMDVDLSDEPVKGSLAEFITDIFQDLNDFLELYQKNSIYSKENAVGELGKLFISNWGKKLLRVLNVLHKIQFDPSISGPDLPGNNAYTI